jgi:hypothetical protein
MYMWSSGWLLFNVKLAIVQLYHDKNKLFFHGDEVRFVLDQHA